ncbi:hypothetical protein Lal_00015760, partial [Lupinus albus]
MINNPAEPSLEELVRQMTMQNMQFQQETRASIQRQESSIQNLTTHMGQMATSLNTLQSQNSDKLPSQTVLNPRNVSAITLRSGKQTEVPTPRTIFSLYTCHAFTDSELCDSCIDEFLNIVVDSPVNIHIALTQLMQESDNNLIYLFRCRLQQSLALLLSFHLFCRHLIGHPIDL